MQQIMNKPYYYIFCLLKFTNVDFCLFQVEDIQETHRRKRPDDSIPAQQSMQFDHVGSIYCQCCLPTLYYYVI